MADDSDDAQYSDYQDAQEASLGAQYRTIPGDPSLGVPNYQAPRPQAMSFGGAQTPPPQYDPNQPNDSEITGQPEPGPPGKTGLRAFGDQVWMSTLGTGQALLGAASLAARKLTSDPDTVAVIERGKQALQDHIESTFNDLDPSVQKAWQSSFWGGQDAQGNDVPVPGRDVSWGSYIGAQVANTVPQVALALLPGGIVGKAATKVFGALGEGAAATAGAVASRATTGAVFGASDAGDAYNAIVEEVDNASPKELSQSPVYAHLRDQGMSDVDARKTLVGQIAPAFAAQRFAVGAAAGVGLGQGLAAGIPGAAERGALARFGIGAAEGAATLGGQAAGDTALQQGAEQQAGLRQGYDVGAIERAGVGGAMGGALLGAGAGVFRTEGKSPEIPASGVGPAEHEALSSALGLGDNAQQGELFNDSQLRQPPVPPPQADAPAGQGDLFNQQPQSQQAMPPAQQPQQGALFSDRQLQQPPVPPPAADAPAGQGDLFNKAAPPAPAPTPAPVTPPASTAKSRAELIAAIKALDPTQKGLAAKKLSDLQDLHGDLLADAATGDNAGQANTTVVASPAPPDGPVAGGSSAGPPPAPEANPPGAAGAVSEGQPGPGPARGGEAKVQAAPPSPTSKTQPFETPEQPTPEQAESGDYRKGHVEVGGLPITIETAAGQLREGVGPDGKPWSVEMPVHYGEVDGTKGADRDPVDVFIKPGTEADAQNKPAFVIDQKDPATAKFDEHKGLLGFDSEAEARAAYEASFSDGSGASRIGAITEMPFEQFKDWSASGDTKKALAYQPTVAEQVRAKVASKRAAEKARMAEVTGRTKGIAYVEPDAPAPSAAPVEGPPARTRQEAMAALKEAMPGVMRSATVRKGVPVEQAIRDVMRDVQDLIGRTQGDFKTDEVVKNAVRDWGKTDQFAKGTTTRKADLATLMLKKLGGEETDSAMAREAAAEVEHAPQVFESEQGSRPTIEDEHAEAPSRDEPAADSPTVVDGEAEPDAPTVVEGQDAPRPSARVEHAGNKVQQADELMTRVEQGLMTPQEAHAEYGMAKAEGKKRKYPTFASYLRAMADAGDDPERQAALLKKLQNPKNAESLKKTLRQQIERSSPEYTAKLRGWADQIDDPVGEGVKAANREAMAQRMRDTIAARAPRKLARIAIDGNRSSSRYVAAARSPELNDFLMHSLQRSEAAQIPYTLHDALRQIVNNRGAAGEMQPLHFLARRLLDLAPDIEVLTPEGARERGYIPEDEVSNYSNRNGLLGSYNQEYAGTPEHIIISPHADGQAGYVSTLVHEGLHSVTARYIDQLKQADPQNRALKALRAIGLELRDQAERDPAIDKGTRDDLDYALTDEHELHTMLMSTPELQTWAARLQASDKLRSQLSSLGYAPGAPGRSVWRMFTDWVRRAMGLPGPASASEYSLLDHIMRPLTDITDQGAKYNAQVGNAPELRDRGLTLLRQAAPALSKTDRLKSELLRTVDTASLGDKVRGGMLSAMPTDAIADRYKELFTHADYGNPLLDYRSANENIGHIAKSFYDQHDGAVGSLLQRLEGSDKLGQLTRDATLADVQLGPGADNSHIKSAEDQAALTKLQARYAALKPEEQKTYTGLRDYYRSVEKQKREAQLRSIITRVFPDATPEQRDELTKVARTRRSIDQFLKKPDDLANVFGTAWETQRDLVRRVMQVHRLGFVQGDYFPLRRFGDYVVRYGDKDADDGSYGVEMFEKRADAQARHDELAKQGTAGLSDVMIKRMSHLSEIAPNHPAVDGLEAAMNQRPAMAANASAVRDLLNTVLMEHATRSEAARTALRRNSVLGASDDAGRVLAREFLSGGRALGYMQGGAERANALERMRDVAHSLEYSRTDGSGIVARQVINELEQRTASGDDAASAASGLARRVSTLGFVQSLMSPSHMLTSSIETHMNSSSLLGARHGAGRAAAALTKALADVTPTMFRQGAANTIKAASRGLKAADWNLSRAMEARLVAKGADAGHMKALVDALDQAGLVDHTAQREMQRIANPSGYAGTGMGKAWQRFMDINAAGAHAVDAANKMAVAKAAFDLEYGRTKDVAKSVAYATDTARRASPNYNLSNKARISTDKGPLGAFAAPLTQFKQYGLHMYSLMANLAKASMHGATPAERSEARKAFAGILATHALMAGGLTLIADPLRYIGGAYDAVTGAQRPHDYEADLRGWMADTFGPELGEVLARGLPHLAGIDLHRRVGLANLLEIPELDEFSGKGVTLALGKLMTGAAGEDAANMAGGAAKMMQGDIMGGLQAVVPRVFRDPIKAQALATTGVKDTRGKVVATPDQLGVGAPIAQALGFQPAALSEFREGRAAGQQVIDEGKQESERLQNAWVAADPADRTAIMSQIRQWNQLGRGTPITQDILYRKLAASQTAAQQQPGAFGLRIPRGATSVAGAGRFANF